MNSDPRNNPDRKDPNQIGDPDTRQAPGKTNNDPKPEPGLDDTTVPAQKTPIRDS